jgi:CheY-like chemotaxis protein
MNEAWPTVLHVEDNLGDKELLQHACEAAQVKCKVQWVEDGQAAVDYLVGAGTYSNRSEYPFPSLMLLDLKMPRKNGFEVLEWLRASKDFRWLPVVVFTASNSAKDTRRCFDLGANSVLVKPTAYRELIEYIRTVYRYWFELNQSPDPWKL